MTLIANGKKPTPMQLDECYALNFKIKPVFSKNIIRNWKLLNVLQ